jgi:hypothetical protein
MARKRAWITLGAFGAGLLIAELAVRWLAHDRVDTEALRAASNSQYLQGLMRLSADPERYYDLRPNHRALFKGRNVAIGPDGFLAESGVAPHDALRVAVVGGSSTFEFGVATDRVWPAVFSRKLQGLVSRPVRLKNFSVPAYVSTQQASVILREVVAWGPDLLIWHYDHRDAYPVMLDEGPPQLAPEVGDNPLRSAAWKLLVRTLRERDAEKLRFKGEETGLFEHFITTGPWYERHVDAIQRVDARMRELEIPVLFVIHDSFLRAGVASQEHFERLHEPLLARLRAMSFRCVDLFEPLQRAMADRGDKDQRAFWLTREPLDAHPNEVAHEYVANAVLKIVAAEPAWLDAVAKRAAERIQNTK